jgi:hypothetical protein
MSELVTTRRTDIRLQLLATVSALSLLSVAASQAMAEDADRPTVWVELGGQLESMPRAEERFSPAFALRQPRPDFETVSPLSLVHPPRHAAGLKGKLLFQPSGSDWVFSAAVRYGRSNAKKHFHNQTYTPTHLLNIQSNGWIDPGRFEDIKNDYSESHTVLDFMVGKDVGLGLFADATASLGVRYAQFDMDSMVNLSSKPDFFKHKFKGLLGKYYSKFGFHNYTAASSAERNFHGIGPALSFEGDVAIARGDAERLTFDWGLNGALLFGRQREKATMRTYGRYRDANQHPLGQLPPLYTYHRTTPRTQSRSVTVPNIGAFAGLSMRYTNAKVSFGYRADVFFGAMDGGLDARREYNRAFYGPFATISIGLGG